MATIYKLKDGIAQTEREARRERVTEHLEKKFAEREACKEKVEAHHPPGITCTNSKCWSCAFMMESRAAKLVTWDWRDINDNPFFNVNGFHERS
ncbi:MAG: hypothetical protein ACW99J_15195 [Candidatus Thorarchaeota archaeon]|jgi:crotonobetainyl-CoA:carnitine CoA-transferase CaiB-like acyl-CoA transferase